MIKNVNTKSVIIGNSPMKKRKLNIIIIIMITIRGKSNSYSWISKRIKKRYFKSLRWDNIFEGGLWDKCIFCIIKGKVNNNKLIG